MRSRDRAREKEGEVQTKRIRSLNQVTVSRDKKDGGARGGTWWGSPVKRATAALSWVTTGYVPMMSSSASSDLNVILFSYSF
jgi:hypothetical protein